MGGNIRLWFWFEFPWWLVMLSAFHVPNGHLNVLFRKMSIQFLCPFKMGLFTFFCYWVVCVFNIFSINPYQIYDLQIFSPHPQVAISFCWWFSFLCRSFLVWYSWTCFFFFFSFFCFCYLCFWCEIQKNYWQDWCQVVYAYVFF